MSSVSGTATGGIAEYQEDGQKIVLDQPGLGNAANEFVASVSFHEMIHTLITEFKGGFLAPSVAEQHRQIFYSWVERERDALLESYPSLNSSDATGLALGGIAKIVLDANGNVRPQIDSIARNRYGTSIDDARAVQTAYSNGSKGTKCNQ